MFKYIKLLLLSTMLLSLTGCLLSMESVDNVLLLNNNSNQKIKILLNLSHPDSSLHKSIPVSYMDPKSSGFLGVTLPLRSQEGITIIIFNYDYYYSKWNKDVGRPDTFLEEDKILKRLVLSKNQLDSTNWTITYP